MFLSHRQCRGPNDPARSSRRPSSAPIPTLAALLTLISGNLADKASAQAPNIILLMADDLGWGDVGFNGHRVLKTPSLDAMARDGLRFERFYSAAPVCSPTRGSCMTGRHPFRYGIPFANTGHMKLQERTLAELMKDLGFATGHFGKWHLGTLTKTQKDSNRGGPKNVAHYSPPWVSGFETCFSTEAKVPTWDPMLKPGSSTPYGTAYWTDQGVQETENLEGDDSRVIMDRAIPFVRAAAKEKKPFFAVIWFHAPHLPVVAGPRHLAMYENVSNEKTRHYYGCVTALDEQVGRLRKELRDLKIADRTMLWFCSDNGPEGKNSAPGKTGGLRGRKRSLFEGGVRVPGVVVWPEHVQPGTETTVPACTSDYLPTILDVLGVERADDRPLDGVSLLPLFEGKMHRRPQPIFFESRAEVSLVDNHWKLIGSAKKQQFSLFDLSKDRAESNDMAAKHPNLVQKMSAQIDEWRASCSRSAEGKDYNGQ